MLQLHSGPRLEHSVRLTGGWWVGGGGAGGVRVANQHSAKGVRDFTQVLSASLRVSARLRVLTRLPPAAGLLLSSSPSQ